jgi:transposase-like protein
MRRVVSRITEKVVAEMAEWASRPLDAVYVAVFIDAIVVRVRDGQVANRPVCAAVRAWGHFPSEQAALKCLYFVTRSLDPTGTGRARWTMRWKPVINAFAITSVIAGRPSRPTN